VIVFVTKIGHFLHNARLCGFPVSFLLGEKFGIVPIITALLTILGIGVITRPPILSGASEFDSNNLVILQIEDFLGKNFKILN